jgi:hypothetical protein
MGERSCPSQSLSGRPMRRVLRYDVLSPEWNLSRRTFYEIRKRAATEGPTAALRPRSRRPWSSPNRIAGEVARHAIGVAVTTSSAPPRRRFRSKLGVLAGPRATASIPTSKSSTHRNSPKHSRNSQSATPQRRPRKASSDGLWLQFERVVEGALARVGVCSVEPVAHRSVARRHLPRRR